MITHTQFFAALEAAGLVKDATAVNRVVIDAKRGQYVIIHVEQLGDDNVLDVTRTLHGPLITEAEPGSDSPEPPEPLASVTDLRPDPAALADVEPLPCTTVTCRKLIFFATTEAGKQMPVDYDTAGEPGGGLAVRRVEGRLRCRVLKPGGELGPGEVPAVSHYVTCTRPDVHRHRRRGVD